MEVFSPLQESEQQQETESVPRAITTIHHSNPHLPLTASKLENYVVSEDVKIESEDLVDEKENDQIFELKSPTKNRSGNNNNVDLMVDFAKPEDSLFVFKDPIVHDANKNNRCKEPTEEDKRMITTPVALSKTRQMDIPSSLEKFKSLKIGLDSLKQTKPASPAKNPFTPPSIPTVEAPQSAFLKGLIEECLSEFKATLRNDIQNLHVEIIKQSMAQQAETRLVIEENLPLVRELMEEIRRLRDENERLKIKLGY